MTALDLTARIEPCMSCRADIAWASTSDGRPLPVNAAPSPTGNVTLQLSNGALFGGQVTKSAAAAMRSGGVALYSDHAIDCPPTAAALKAGTKTRR